jgi:cyclohexanecarboxyl-CoA dehydrogenase
VDGGGYLLSGEKTSVTMLAHAEAMLVTAQTVRDGVSLGVSAFLVDLSSDGIATSDIPDTGWCPMGRGVVHFDGVRVPASARIGAEGAAFRSVLAGFDFTRPLLALTGIGCAQACIDETARYVVDREAFGSPLASFEGVSFPLAEHSTTLEAARLLCYAALWLRDEQRPHSAEASMSKWYGPAGRERRSQGLPAAARPLRLREGVRFRAASARCHGRRDRRRYRPGAENRHRPGTLWAGFPPLPDTPGR